MLSSEFIIRVPLTSPQSSAVMKLQDAVDNEKEKKDKSVAFSLLVSLTSFHHSSHPGIFCMTSVFN